MRVSPEEAGRYLETYKSYEKKPADVLKEQVEKNYLSQVRAQKPILKSKMIMFGSFNHKLMTNFLLFNRLQIV